MTAINGATRPVVRETSALYRGRPLIVELHAGYMILRPKGRRTERYTLDYGAAFELAAKIEARRAAAEQPRKPRK